MSGMQAAWAEHVGKLTLEQLSIPDAYKKHLDEFEMQLVATTLGHTVIGSVYDVQECIASLLRAHPVGGLETMKKLANHQREIMNAVMVNEILEVVKERSIAGFNSTNKIVFTHLKSCSRRSRFGLIYFTFVKRPWPLRALCALGAKQ